MTGLWSVIIPESAEVTNLITNPSFEVDETSWAVKTGAAGAITTVSTYQRRGYKSCHVATDTGTSEGVYYDAAALTSGTAYIFAFDFREAYGYTYSAYFADTAGTLAGTATSWTGTNGQWERKTVSYSATATGNFRVYVIKTQDAVKPVFYIDGAGIYALDHDPGHIDGEQKDCVWNGTPHASTSKRLAGSAEGGEVTNFDDLSYYIKEFPGAGMAEVAPLLQEIGSLPGAIDAGEKITERVFNLVGTVTGSSQAGFHANRKALMNTVKSDRVKNKQQVKLVYSGANSTRPVRISAKFVGGLGLGSQDGFSEAIGLKFLATDPFWYEDGVEGAALTVEEVSTDAYSVIYRKNGDWSAITGFADTAYVLAINKYNGKVYLGGTFEDVGTVNGDRILSFDGDTIAALGTGLDGQVKAIAPSANGNIYVGGYFTAAGGVANTSRFAYWDTTTSAWKAVGTGFGAIASTDGVEAITIDHNGSLYVGGNFVDFTDANGDFISCYSATGWGSLGTGLNSVCYALATGPDGYIYVGGAFTAAGGDTDCIGIARWTGTAWQSLGSGVAGGTAIVYCMAFDDFGNLYIGGDFTSVDGVSALNIAKYNGNSWSALGTGIDNFLRRMSWGNGLLYFTGPFTTIGGIAVPEGIGLWNGSSYAVLPVDFATATLYTIFADGDDLYIGGDMDGTAHTSYVNTLTNTGTAISYPKFCFSHVGGAQVRLVYIRNETTGATMYFDYYIMDGEVLEIDTHPTVRAVTSTVRGNIVGAALLRNSDFSDFYLLPGENKISVFMTASSPPSATYHHAVWPITHWSLDGSST